MTGFTNGRWKALAGLDSCWKVLFLHFFHLRLIRFRIFYELNMYTELIDYNSYIATTHIQDVTKITQLLNPKFDSQFRYQINRNTFYIVEMVTLTCFLRDEIKLASSFISFNDLLISYPLEIYWFFFAALFIFNAS